uniref:hypothetical protein n=1 Tax=Ornithinimicrobium sufpigmenti TaxID=2508882 RepID=UPI0037C8A648
MRGTTSLGAVPGASISSGAGILMQRVVKSGKRKGQTVTDVKVPWIKATEVTVSYDNGWHVHLHVVIFLA